MTTAESYDAVVIGTGQAGKPLAKSLAKHGKRTAVIERDDLVGGSCVVSGCTPTKTMVASARVAHLVRRAADFGVRTGTVSLDMERVRARKRDIVEKFSGGSRKGLERADNIDLIFGEASFLGEHEIRVVRNDDGREQILSAPLIFINTGTRPAIPDIPGLADIPFLTNKSIMELGEAPEHLVILGGGYIGVEFGQMFRRFGSRVTIVQRGRQLLSREDEDLAQAVMDILTEDGLDVLLQTEATSFSRDGEGRTAVTIVGPEGERQLDATAVLVAAGRSPNSDVLHLEAAGIETDPRGFIPVSSRLETAVGGVYVLGDVKGGPAFTHISYDDYRIVEANLLEEGDASTEGRLVPYAVFMDPELGRVGLSERQAKQQNVSYRVAKMPMSHVARALESDETRGFMKALVHPDTNQILGCAVLGIQGGEIMSVLQVAMMGRVAYTSLRDGVFAHPTVTESLNNLFMSFSS